MGATVGGSLNNGNSRDMVASSQATENAVNNNSFSDDVKKRGDATRYTNIDVIEVFPLGKIFIPVDVNGHQIPVAGRINSPASKGQQVGNKTAGKQANDSKLQANGSKLEANVSKSEANKTESTATNGIGGNGYSIHQGKQNKHIPGTNEYKNVHERSDRQRSILTVDPQPLLSKLGTGKQVGDIKVGLPGSKERIDFGRDVGYYTDGKMEPVRTTNGMVHYGKDGTVHIVPSSPN